MRKQQEIVLEEEHWKDICGTGMGYPDNAEDDLRMRKQQEIVLADCEIFVLLPSVGQYRQSLTGYFGAVGT